MVVLYSSLPSWTRLGKMYSGTCGNRKAPLRQRQDPTPANDQGLVGVDCKDRRQLNRREWCLGGDPWLQRSVSDKQMQRFQTPEAGKSQPAGPQDGGRSEIADSILARQRAHVERLELAGATDKTTEGYIGEVSVAEGRISGSSQFHFGQNSPVSKRCMNSTEVRLLQSIGQAVVCTDLQGIITYWNRAAETMYKWKAEEVVGSSLVQLLTPKNLLKEASEIMAHVSKGESWSGPFPCVRKDGVLINTVVTNTPIVDSMNSLVGIIGVSFDVSSIHSSDDKIRRSRSDEGLSWEILQDNAQVGGSDEVKHYVGWRRIYQSSDLDLIDAEAGEDSDSNKATGRSLLKLGRTSVQQLLRKLLIRTGGRQEEDAGHYPERQSSWDERDLYESLRGSGSVGEHSPSYHGNHSSETIGADYGESGDVTLPLISHSRPAGSGRDGGSWESISQKDLISKPMSVSNPGAFLQSLSRTSSGSAPGSTGSPQVASTVGSPIARSSCDMPWNPPEGGMNFQQAEEDFQLQLALALRVAAEAAAVDDPDLVANVRGPIGSTKLVPGVSKIEATAYRYWVSNCLSYEDQIEDGFYEVWGMSPYVWSMCTDSNDLGRMPPLESLRNVHPSEADFEVVLVDRNTDRALRELEDKAVGLAYESTEVLAMASKVSIMVANVMGGPALSDEELLDSWQLTSSKLMQGLGSVVLPIGVLRVGLRRHRALLFKVMCDSVGLPCRLVRGTSYCGKEDAAMCVVKCGNDREWMVDLLSKPGTIMPPDARMAAPPAVIASPLQFERSSPFAGSNFSVLDWVRGELGNNKELEGKGDPNARNELVRADSESSAKGNQGSGSGGSAVAHVLEFSKAGSSKNPIENYGVVTLLDRPVASTVETVDGQLNLSTANENLKLSGEECADQQELFPGDNKSGKWVEKAWSKEDRKVKSGDNPSVNKLGRVRVVERMASLDHDYEIMWDDIVMGERIGQGAECDASYAFQFLFIFSSKDCWIDELDQAGSYGKVYRADWQGSDVAVKVFLDQDLKMEALEEFKAEVAIMRRLRHPNIVLFMGAVTRPPNLSIITEFCPRGSLYRLLHRPNRELDDRRRIRMAVDVVKGMNYLHRCSPPVVHRDLKSPNLLVDKNWTVKVCDFGLSRQKHSTFLSSKSSAGTPEWMAPEVLRNEPSDEKLVAEMPPTLGETLWICHKCFALLNELDHLMSDVYSFGVILWELATLQVPWNGMNPIQVVGAVGFQHRRLTVPDTVDPAITAIIQACWRTDSKLRPSFADLMQELRNLQKPNAAQTAASPAGP